MTSNSSSYTSGGWSFRDTLWGAHGVGEGGGRELDSSTEPARIRAFFTDPAFARRGAGSAILEACETAAREAGFRRAVLGATYTGAKLYRARGWRETGRDEAELPGGDHVGIVRMEKALV